MELVLPREGTIESAVRARAAARMGIPLGRLAGVFDEAIAPRLASTNWVSAVATGGSIAGLSTQGRAGVYAISTDAQNNSRAMAVSSRVAGLWSDSLPFYIEAQLAFGGNGDLVLPTPAAATKLGIGFAGGTTFTANGMTMVGVHGTTSTTNLAFYKHDGAATGDDLGIAIPVGFFVLAFWRRVNGALRAAINAAEVALSATGMPNLSAGTSAFMGMENGGSDAVIRNLHVGDIFAGGLALR